MTDSASGLALVGLAGVAGGAINALAGGGTLVTFPVLLAAGLPPVAANVTNTVALCPGYLGATFAQRADFRGQRARLRAYVPAGVVGGVFGGLLLLRTGEQSFRAVAPYLILLASGLLAAQEPVRRWLARRAGAGSAQASVAWAWPAVALASIYGGYFGAGLSVIVLAVLGLTVDDSLPRLNALKVAISFGANAAAAVLFLFSSRVVWPVAAAMAAGAILGGALGGALAGRVKPQTLRLTVVAIGVVVGIVYLVR